MKKLKYNEKTVVITGASSGIGKKLAELLIKKHSCRVYAIARNQDRLDGAKSVLGENYIPYRMDATDKQEWTHFKDFLEKSNTRVDILINCAGVLPEFKKLEKTSIDELESVLKINFLASVYSIKELMPLINERGAVVNISSASALCPFGGVSTYTSSKSALDSFTVSLGCEYKNISVSSVLPGFVRTDIMKNQRLNEKEAKLIRSFSADAEKTARKILRRVARRKRRIIVGKDAHLMSFLYKFFPRLAPRLITKFLKKSGLELFNQI
ncbi:MAG: SDR family oxidoreductase [Clostridia bacterium]|nr:SDR family oxidoreductase [Clostridia bacterium]